MAADKVRLYDIARELQLDSKEVLNACDQQNIAYKSISSTISPAEADNLRNFLRQHPPAVKPKDKPPKKNQPPAVEAPRPQIVSVAGNKSPAPAVLTPPPRPPEPAAPKPEPPEPKLTAPPARPVSEKPAPKPE
ncbi:MAG: translation initiation factor IF-2 N-terminal domain-containing protein, partial [Pseudanabaenaceae cyanobacterium]